MDGNIALLPLGKDVALFEIMGKTAHEIYFSHDIFVLCAKKTPLFKRPCWCIQRHRDIKLAKGSKVEKKERRIRQACRQTDRQTNRQAGRQAGRQADRQTDNQTGRQTGKQTDRQTIKRGFLRDNKVDLNLHLYIVFQLVYDSGEGSGTSVLLYSPIQWTPKSHVLALI